MYFALKYQRTEKYMYNVALDIKNNHDKNIRTN